MGSDHKTITRKSRKYLIQSRVAKHAFDATDKIRIQNQGFLLMEISDKVKHQFPCQDLTCFPAERAKNNIISQLRIL